LSDEAAPPGRKARLGRIVRPILASRPVREFLEILHRYDAAGGGLLASGLAYSALFAIVPTIIFLLGLSGLVIGDPLDRAAVIDTITTVAAPLRPFLTDSLDALTAEATSVSVVGFVTLAWGASRFLIALEYALARILSGDEKRGFLERQIVGLLAVVGLVGAVVGGAILAGVASFVAAFAEEVGPGQIVSSTVELAFGAVAIAVTTLATAAVYRFLPAGTPSWRSIAVPTIVVAIALAIATRLFVFVAPRLIGAAAILGTLATVFVALAWLGIVFQAILIGAAWIRARSERLDGPPTETASNDRETA